MNKAETLKEWLLLIYRVPQDPAGRRTFVWRTLKRLGAVYLQQAAAVLPESPATRAGLEELAAHIRSFYGEVSLLPTTSPDLAWEQSLIAQFNQARNEEYAEFIKDLETSERAIQRAISRSNYTFAQLEDLEADWDKLQRWYERITSRDFFGAPDGPKAAQALERGKTAWEAFVSEAEAQNEHRN